nr:hypothetical protein Itr_chr01CG16720 [Ipomoea trifida]
MVEVHLLNLLWEHLLPCRRRGAHSVAVALPSSAVHQRLNHCSLWNGTGSELCSFGIPSAPPSSESGIFNPELLFSSGAGDHGVFAGGAAGKSTIRTTIILNGLP